MTKSTALFYFPLLLLCVSVYAQPTQIGRTINAYAVIISHSPCFNSFIVDDASEFKAGDTVYIMQMKGAVIDSNDSPGFGTITNYAASSFCGEVTHKGLVMLIR